MPECLRRFDWREWRPTSPPECDFPFYSEWVLGMRDWDEAREAWLAGRPVLLPPERPLSPAEPYRAPFREVQGDWKPPPGMKVVSNPHRQWQPPLDN